MKILTIGFMLFFSGMLLFAQTEKQLVIGEQPVYKIARAKGTIVADGKMDEEAWKAAEIRSFDYFFRRDEPLEKQATKFRMLWDDANLYLFYEFEDVSINHANQRIRSIAEKNKKNI